MGYENAVAERVGDAAESGEVNYLRLNEVAKRLGVSSGTVSKWAMREDDPCPVLAVEKVWLFVWDDVVSWLKRQTEKARAAAACGESVDNVSHDSNVAHVAQK